MGKKGGSTTRGPQRPQQQQQPSAAQRPPNNSTPPAPAGRGGGPNSNNNANKSNNRQAQEPTTSSSPAKFNDPQQQQQEEASRQPDHHHEHPTTTTLPAPIAYAHNQHHQQQPRGGVTQQGSLPLNEPRRSSPVRPATTTNTEEVVTNRSNNSSRAQTPRSDEDVDYRARGTLSPSLPPSTVSVSRREEVDESTATSSVADSSPTRTALQLKSSKTHNVHQEQSSIVATPATVRSEQETTQQVSTTASAQATANTQDQQEQIEDEEVDSDEPRLQPSSASPVRAEEQQRPTIESGTTWVTLHEPAPQNGSNLSQPSGTTSMSASRGVDERPLLHHQHNNEDGAAAAHDRDVSPPSYGSTSSHEHRPLSNNETKTDADATTTTRAAPAANSSPQSPSLNHYQDANDRVQRPPPLTTVDESPTDDDLASSSPRSSRYPYTVAIVNPLSGERSAAEFVYQCLCDDLGPRRVLKLNRDLFRDPAPIQKLIATAIRRDGTRGTVVVSGGDGTVAFVMSQIDKLAIAHAVDAIVVVDGIGAVSPSASSHSGVDGGEDGGNHRLSPHMMPAVAVLALGTGNDFSNCMGFGNGYTKHKLCCMCVCCVNHVESILAQVVAAPACPFDRWVATITPQVPTSSVNLRAPPTPAPPPPAPFVVPPREVIFMNYFSFGMDAFIATHFDKLRKAHPSFFQYRFQNKGWYGGLGLYGSLKSDALNTIIPKVQMAIERGPLSIPPPPAATTASAPTAQDHGASNLHDDGPTASITSVLPPSSKALVLSNVSSYSGGTVLWHPSKRGSKFCVTPTPSPVYVNDKQLEVQALGGLVDMSLLQLKIGSGADKMAQAKEVRITVGNPNSNSNASTNPKGLKVCVPLQADGEPIGCLMEPSEVHVKLYSQQIFVRCANRSVVRATDPVDIVHLL